MNKLILNNDDALMEIEHMADDDYEYFGNRIFFFGELYNENPEFAKDIDDGKTYALCPVCNHLIETDSDIEILTEITCPHCGADGELYPYRDRSQPLDDIGYTKTARFEEYENGYVLRIFEYSFDYSNREYENYYKLDHYPDLFVQELYREYWSNGHIEYYAYKNDRWEQTSNKPDETNCYLTNWDNDDVCTLEDATNGEKTFMELMNAHTPLKAYQTFLKYGFVLLAKETLTIDESPFPNDTRISVLLDGVDYNKLVSIWDPCEVDSFLLNYCRQLKNYCLTISKDNVWIIQYLRPENVSKETAQKTFKYLRHIAKGRYSEIIKDYNDYLSDCRKTGQDVNNPEIRYPSDFAKAHEREYKKVLAIDNKAKHAKFKKTVRKYLSIEGFADDNYQIIIAKTPGQLQGEGKALHHCVGTYVDRISEGSCLIFFVRRNADPQKPFYTLELNPNDFSIVQCRGDHNKSYTENEDIKTFVSDWRQWAIRQIKKTA